MPDVASPVVAFRDRKELLPLHGGRCPRCGAVQFPRHPGLHRVRPRAASTT